MSEILLYVTAADEAEAVKIARAVVDERLCACANLLGPIRSFYRWNGAVQDDAEVALILKTREDLLEAATARVRDLHSYTVPCVVALPIAGGNPEFLSWIGEETQGTPEA